MADLTERYSWNESLDRIYRLLKGDATSEAPESLVPPLHSANESLSLIAELLAGTLGGSDAVAPPGLSREYGIKYQNPEATAQTLASGAFTIIPFGYTGEVSTNVSSVSNGLKISSKGDYEIDMNLRFNGSTGTDYRFYLTYNGVFLATGKSEVEVRASGTSNPVHLSTIVAVTDANLNGSVIGYMVTPNDGNVHFRHMSGQLVVRKLS